MTKVFSYDIALSFADEDRVYVDKVARLLKIHGVKVFYDEFEEAKLWGKNLFDYLSDVYSKESRYTIIFISKKYAEKLWTNHERQAMQARAFSENREYVLPARFDDTELPGMLPTIGYVSLKDKTPKDFCDIIIKKLAISSNTANPEKNLEKELEQVDKRSILEGILSPKHWFINWQDNINEPDIPPRHWLLKSVFIKSKLYDSVISELLEGKKKAGITGFLGMGGVGKTYTALKVSWDLIENYNWKVVWVGLLQQGTDEALDSIAKVFGLFFVSSLKREEKVSAIRILFNEAQKKFPKLLVVLDNAENFPRLDLLLEGLRNVQVLVTSRKPECSDVVPYHKISPMKEEVAIEYCRKLLNHYNIRIETAKRDVDNLQKLCELLGGHPLGIRLALSGFLRKPLLQQMRMNRFGLLIDEILNNGLVELKSSTPQSNSRDESQLHQNIESTFSWTYSELGLESNGKGMNCAYLLLPIMSALGTSSVDKNICLEGIKYLLNESHYHASAEAEASLDDGKEYIASDEKAAILDLLHLLASNDVMFETAISELVDLALVEILDADEYQFAIHPLIREFSFHHIEIPQESEKNGYIKMFSSEDIYEMAIEVIGKQDQSEALLDLLPRIKKSRQLVETAINRVRKIYDALYFHVNQNTWPYIVELLQKTLKVTNEVNLKKEKVWLLLTLGEIYDRMGDDYGLQLIKEGIDLFIDLDSGEESGDVDLQMTFDWIFKSYETRGKILWGCSYLFSMSNNEINEGKIEHVNQITRLLFIYDKYSLSRMRGSILRFVCKNNFEKKSFGLCSINQSLVSNTIIDLRDFLSLLISHGIKGNKIQLALNLYEKAISKSLEAISKSLKYENYKITKEQSLDFGKIYLIKAFEYKMISDEQFFNDVSRLRIEYKNNGIRGFGLEAEYCVVEAKRALEEKKYKKALDFFTQGLRSLDETSNSNDNIIWRNEILIFILSVSVLENDEVVNVKQFDEELSPLIALFNSCFYNEGIPLIYFAKACYAYRNDNSKDCENNIMLCELAFLEYLGFVPPFVRPYISEWKSWSPSSNNLIVENFTPWVIDFDALPRRVKSRKDDSTMILIRPGIQWDESGKEVWLWPFYIDESPINLKIIERYCKETGEGIATGYGTPDIINFGNSSTNIVDWLGKKIPTKKEIFAAWLQIEQGIFPEEWKTKEDMFEGMYKRISHVIEKGKSMGVDIKELIEVNKKIPGLNLENNHPDKAISNKEDSPSQVDYLYSGKWLFGNKKLEEIFQNKAMNRLRYTQIKDETKRQLAILIIASPSLNSKEKDEVFKAAEDLDDEGESRLTNDKCLELINIFKEDRVKFIELESQYRDDVHKLLKKNVIAYLESIGIFYVDFVDNWNKWCVWVTKVTHTDKWMSQKGESDALLPYSIGGGEEYTPVLRGVIPIFTKKDMENLIPLE